MNSYKTFFLILLIFTLPSAMAFQNINNQTISADKNAPKPIRKIVKAIAKANIFVLKDPAQASTLVEEQEENYSQLLQLATTSELEDLILTHKNAAVRIYAFKALTTHLHHIPENIMYVVNADTTLVESVNHENTEKIELKQLVQHFLN
ncbi:MAG: hypothetical protein ABIN48_03000 [Ginsengibacter sp.]